MKKKLFSFIIAFAFIFTAGLCLTACGGKNDKTPQKEYLNVGVSLTAENWAEGYDYVSSVGIESDTSSLGDTFATKETISHSNPNFEKGKTLTCTIRYKNGYDPNTVTVTETNGTTFIKEMGTGDNADKLYIKATPTASVNYEFTLSVPKAYEKSVSLFDNEDISSYSETNNARVYNFLKNAQICIDNEGVDTFVNIAEEKGDVANKHLELVDGKMFKVDMSQEKAYLYVRFDKTNSKKLVYKISDLQNLFKLTNSTFGDPAIELSTYTEAGDYREKAFYDTSKQAYRFEFDLDNLKSDNLNLTLNLDSIDSALTYEEYRVTINDLWLNEAKKLHFEPDANNKYKKYEDQQTFVFNLENAESHSTVLNLSTLVFKIGSETIASSFDGSNMFTLTLDANKSPFDYPSEKTDAFYIDIDIESIGFRLGRLVNTLTASKEIETVTGYDGIVIDKGENVISKSLNDFSSKHNFLYANVKNSNLYESFKLKIKYNDREIEKTFTSGIHYNLKGIDDSSIASDDPIRDLNIFASPESKVIYSNNGEAEDTIIDVADSAFRYIFIAYDLEPSEKNLRIMFNMPATMNINAECYISDIVYRNDIDISFIVDENIKNFEVKKDGVTAIEQDANNSNKYNLKSDSKLEAFEYTYEENLQDSENSYLTYYFEIKLYSNNNHFCTVRYDGNNNPLQLSEELNAANWSSSFYVITISMYSNDKLITFSPLSFVVSMQKQDGAYMYVDVDKIEIAIKTEIHQYGEA